MIWGLVWICWLRILNISCSFDVEAAFDENEILNARDGRGKVGESQTREAKRRQTLGPPYTSPPTILPSSTPKWIQNEMPNMRSTRLVGKAGVCHSLQQELS